MVTHTIWADSRSCGSASSSVWLTVLYDSDHRIVLPNEESVSTNIRLYYKSSELTKCNYTNDVINPGVLYVIDLGYNKTESLMFTNLNTSEFVVYNVFTFDSVEDYKPVGALILLADAISFYSEIGFVSACFAVFGVIIAFKLRSS